MDRRRLAQQYLSDSLYSLSCERDRWRRALGRLQSRGTEAESSQPRFAISTTFHVLGVRHMMRMRIPSTTPYFIFNFTLPPKSVHCNIEWYQEHMMNPKNGQCSQPCPQALLTSSLATVATNAGEQPDNETIVLSGGMKRTEQTSST